jgi:hypothetical protein
MGWVVSITHRPRFIPWERTTSTHWVGGWWASELVWTQMQEENPFASAGDRTPVVQSVVSHCTEWAQSVCLEAESQDDLPSFRLTVQTVSIRQRCSWELGLESCVVLMTARALVRGYQRSVAFIFMHLTSALGGSERSASRSGHVTPEEIIPGTNLIGDWVGQPGQRRK